MRSFTDHFVGDPLKGADSIGEQDSEADDSDSMAEFPADSEEDGETIEDCAADSEEDGEPILGFDACSEEYVYSDSPTESDENGAMPVDDGIESDEELVDMDVGSAIISARLKANEKPPEVVTEDYLVDITFHPSVDLIAGASISGDAIVYKYSLESTEVVATHEVHNKACRAIEVSEDGDLLFTVSADKIIMVTDSESGKLRQFYDNAHEYKYSLESTEVVATHEVHNKACRAIEFSEDGDLLFTVSADKSIMVTDSESGKLRQFYDNAHEDPLYSLAIIDEHLIATGDENGVVRLWDLRQRSHVFSSKKMEDCVSKILTNEKAKHLVCVSGEGSVVSFDIAAKCVHIQSELYEAEFTCAGLIRKESKLVVGSNRGTLVFYNWGEFGLHTDELPFSKKESINCLIPISENIVLTGWEYGVIRATYLFPHQQLGMVGHHNLSVEALDISHDGAYVASTSVDQTLRFWPISYFEDSDFLSSINKSNNQRNLPSSNVTDAADFFSGLA